LKFLCGLHARQQNVLHFYSNGLGVCPCVRPSVTLLYCIKTVQAKITKSSL